jgi:hypothetical protein
VTLLVCCASGREYWCWVGHACTLGSRASGLFGVVALGICLSPGLTIGTLGSAWYGAGLGVRDVGFGTGICDGGGMGGVGFGAGIARCISSAMDVIAFWVSSPNFRKGTWCSVGESLKSFSMYPTDWRR